MTGAAGKRGQEADGSWQVAVGSDEAVEAVDGEERQTVRAYVSLAGKINTPACAIMK